MPGAAARHEETRPIGETVRPEILASAPARVHQHPRFRVARARALRGAVVRATLVLAVASIVSGAPLIWLYPREGPLLATVGAIEAVMWTAVAVWVRHVPRRYLAPVASCVAILVLPGPLLTMATLPAQYATTLGYLVVVPPAVALFIPWTPRAHGIWLLLYVGLGSGFALSPLAGSLTTEHSNGLALALVSAALVSFIGQRRLQQTWEREFSERLRLRTLNELARAQRAELRQLNRQLAESVRRDPLTGLSNRLALSEDLVALWDQHVRYGHRYAAVMLDLDRFKALNDRFGHLAGDSTLLAVATAFRAETRPGDGLYRYGGEEFLVILPEASPGAALDTAQRLCRAVADLAILHPDNVPWGIVTISAGVAMMATEVDATDDWLRRADTALYRAKEAGRNHVGTWDPSEATSPAPEEPGASIRSAPA